MLSLYAMHNGRKQGIRWEKLSWPKIAGALKGAAWEVPLPIIVLGGIYGGLITVMEAAAITALYAFVVEVFIYRDVSLPETAGRHRGEHDPRRRDPRHTLVRDRRSRTISSTRKSP